MEKDSWIVEFLAGIRNMSYEEMAMEAYELQSPDERHISQFHFDKRGKMYALRNILRECKEKGYTLVIPYGNQLESKLGVINRNYGVPIRVQEPTWRTVDLSEE